MEAAIADMKDIRITIKLAKNGIVVSYYKSNKNGPGEEVTYVYEDLKEALKELPGIISVAKESNPGKDKDTLED